MSSRSTKRQNGVYLGKAGKVHGPYTETEAEELLAKKDSHFTWIWNHADSCWKPVEPPPPPLTFDDEKPQAESALLSANGFTAVCHDFRNMVSGNIRNVTEIGCELVCTDPSASPTFTQKGNMIMNLLDERNGRSINVSVSLADVVRDQGSWTYRVRWESCPEILLTG